MLRWDPHERILRGIKEEWALPFVAARVFHELWCVRGNFLPADRIALNLNLDLDAVQDAVKILRAELPLFNLFIVTRGNEPPREYRLVLDHFFVAAALLGETRPAPSFLSSGNAVDVTGSAPSS